MAKHDIEAVIDRYILSDPQRRKEIKNYVQQSQVLLNSCLWFMSYSAVQAVRRKSETMLLKGLYANVIEEAKEDPRDNISDLTLIYHSAIMIGLNPDDIFRKVAADTTGAGKKLLAEFLKRSPEDKTLKCMGYKTITTPEFDYVWDGLDTAYIEGDAYTEETDKALIRKSL